MLRHRFPFKTMPDLRLESEPTTVPPLMRAPHEVEFRPNADLDELVGSVTKYTRLRVSAAVGAGKSTNFPRLLSEKMGKVVVHAVPSVYLAVDLFDYLSKRFPGQYSLAIDEKDVPSETGVLITTYAWIAGRMLRSRGQSEPIGKCVLYADEVHESDCYVEFVRRLGGKIPGVSCFVEASATHSPDRMPKREAKGTTETVAFAKESPDTWQPADITKPWSAVASGGNMVVYVDDKATALQLVSRYGACGVQAYRLHSRMDVEEFRGAMRAMRDTSGGIVVLVAEYTFRNGFTFDVSRIVDSGIVKYYVYEDGLIRARYRYLYELEKYQTMARGGRTVGSVCTYYLPRDLSYESKLCSLEGVECEAASLLFRLYGYAPPLAVQEVSAMKDGPVPVNLCEALNGVQPLVALPAESTQSLVVPVTVDVHEVADVVDSYGFPESPVNEVDDLFASFKLDQKVPMLVGGDSGFLDELQEMSTSARTLLYGHYYSCCEAVDTGACGRLDWQVLLKSIHDSPLIVTGYTSEMRSSAVAILLEGYNKSMVFGAGVSRIGAHKEQLHSLSLKFPQQTQIWSSWLSERSTWHRMMANSALVALEKLRTPAMNFIAVDSLGALEESQARTLMQPLMTAVSVASVRVDAHGFFDNLRDKMQLEPGPEFPEVSDDGVGSKFLVRSRTVSVLGFVKHNLLVYPKLVGLSEQDYVEAISALLNQKGIVASAVHKLEIDAPGIDGRKVMQRVRDGFSVPPKTMVYSVKRLTEV